MRATAVEASNCLFMVATLDADVGDGVTELTCHPGFVEPGLQSTYAAEREVEVTTLCDRRVRQAIHDRGIRLIGFRDLPALTVPEGAR